MRVLVDAIEGTTAIARSEADAPEIDGVVRIAGASARTAAEGVRLRPGDWADVEIVAADAYDLTGRLIGG
jgi:ribosomal protein S12 methylthiotransferase